MSKKISSQFYVSILLVCTFTLFFSWCYSTEKNILAEEKALYSISSLCFHLNELVPEDSLEGAIYDEHIVFDDEDVLNLWQAACQNSSSIQLLKAQQFYYQAKEAENNTLVSNKLYAKSKNLLNKIWKKITSKIFESQILPDCELNAHGYFYKSLIYPHLEDNPIIHAEMARQITPYLLPIEHPIKHHLDAIFKKSRAIADEKSFDQAGFETLFIQTIHSFIRVAKHTSLPGYLLKVYLDSEPNERARKGWLYLKNRCEGAEKVRELIHRKKIIHFNVPDKWLYVLPPKTPYSSKDQPVLLVVTDMKLVSDSKTEQAWKSKITQQHLDELYCVISHGLGSSGLVRNVPYTRDKMFTFIDTEKPKKVPNYAKVKLYLSPEMQAYWDKLVRSGGRGHKNP